MIRRTNRSRHSPDLKGTPRKLRSFLRPKSVLLRILLRTIFLKVLFVGFPMYILFLLKIIEKITEPGVPKVWETVANKTRYFFEKHGIFGNFAWICDLGKVWETQPSSGPAGLRAASEGKRSAWPEKTCFACDLCQTFWSPGSVMFSMIYEKNRICFHEITKKALENAVANPRYVDMNMVVISCYFNTVHCHVVVC